MSKKKLLHKDDNNGAVYLTHDGYIEIAIPGRSISKSIDKWVSEEVTYANKVLVKRINELEAELNN
ncbi:hypothetical protein [Halobacillus litoralis]|uniref:hypothetical protein n=1 Tax=Halobacillus litoralis TaxID=45668 RepID=UPI001CD1D6D7|nr:hypothetical protein [Halobacillus litoralis]MCA1021496.1 hypothetical protein [Halobacillus litoralis]